VSISIFGFRKKLIGARQQKTMKFICIGRNYQAHAAEMNAKVTKDPIFFMKPETALLQNNNPLYYPDFTKDLHFEVELLVKICNAGKHISPQFAHKYYEEVSVGIDFTARDVQQRCKENGHPWEIAKAWNHSAPVGQFIPIEEARNADGDIEFSLQKNGQVVQQGNSNQMIADIDQLISYVSKFILIKRGDILFTGTPKGVGPVQLGDQLEAFIGKQSLLKCEIK